MEDRKVVTSPSYVIVKQYMGRLPIYHFDAYRLKSADEMYEIDCVGFFWGNGISIIEWADKVMECLPDEFIKITIKILGKHYEVSMCLIKEKDTEILWKKLRRRLSV